MTALRSTFVALVATGLFAGCFGLPRTLTRPNLPDEAAPIEFSPRVEVFDLPNHLTLAVAPEASTNLVLVDVRYPVGAADDPPGKTGLSHFVEHILFTMRDGPGQPTLADRMSTVTLSFNAYTTADETHYSAVALAANLRAVLDIERDRMSADCTRIDDELLEREKDVVIQEINERGGAEAGRFVSALFGADHAYARGVSGGISSVRAFTRDDVCSFITDHYGPNDAVLVVSGAVEPEVVHTAVSNIIGTVEMRARPPRADVGSIEPATVTVELDVDHPTVLIAFPTVAFGNRDVESVRVASEVMRDHLRGSGFPKLRDADMISMTAARSPVLVFALSIEEGGEADLAKLVDAFFEEQKEAEDGVYNKYVRLFVREQQTELLENFEPMQRRALTIADYLTYTNHRAFIGRDLKELEILDARTVSGRLGELERSTARIITVIPGKSDDRPSVRTVLDETTRDHDIDAWREPVDIRDADRALEPPRRPTPPSPTELELPNGLRVVLAPKADYPLVDIRLVVPAGHDHSPSDGAAVPFLAAHLIGMPNLDRYVLRDQVAARNAVSNSSSPFAFVRDDFTTFRVRGAAVDIAAMLWRLQFGLEHGDYDSDDLETVKRILAELADIEDSNESLERELLGSGKGVRSGVLESVARVGIGDLRAFKRDHFHVGGATLIVTGQFDVDPVTDEIRRLFGALEPGERSPETSPDGDQPSDSAAAVSDIGVVDDDATQLRVLFTYRIDRGSFEDGAATRVAQTIVELRARLVRDRLGAAYGVGVSLSSLSDDWLLVVSTNVSLSAAPQTLRELDAELQALRTGTDVRDDFVRARRRVLEELLITSSDSRSIADELEIAVRNELAWDYPNEMLRAVAEVTHDRAKRALADTLQPERATRMLVGPKATVQAAYEALGITDVRWID
jgi:zinc protease